MATFSYKNVGIAGLSAAVPLRRFNNYADNPNFSEEDAKAIVDKTGIFERRVANETTTATDLAFAAAEGLINQMQLDRNVIDALILVTQTPDYRMPASSFLLQHQLALPKSCMALDINIGCSGFVVGLNLAYSLLQQENIQKVMLLNAETRTKVYSFKDRQTGFLFGDAATACLVSKGDQFGTSYFKIDSDGSKSNYIMAKSGGYRNPSTPESFIEREQENGRFHSDEQGFMDGAGVFEFVITEVPRHIKEVLKSTGHEKEDIDHYVFHQANKFMNEHLVKKLKLDQEKVPFCLDRYGNTSSVSIPLTIVAELKDVLKTPKKAVISGFGVGLSLGSAYINLVNPFIPPIIEV